MWGRRRDGGLPLPIAFFSASFRIQLLYIGILQPIVMILAAAKSLCTRFVLDTLYNRFYDAEPMKSKDYISQLHKVAGVANAGPDCWLRSDERLRNLNYTLPPARFLYCRPYYSRWDFSVKGECWPASVSEVTAYVQISSNILTDLIYAAAPIVYLRNVHLSEQTQWGVRIVFMMALVGTGISIAKIPITYEFLRSKEVMWDAIDLSICSLNEVCVGIIIANVPALRKTILGLMSRVIPASFATSLGVSSRKHTSQNHHVSSMYTSKGHTKLGTDGNESERSILELEDKKGSGTRKTTHVIIRDDAQSCHTQSGTRQI